MIKPAALFHSVEITLSYQTRRISTFNNILSCWVIKYVFVQYTYNNGDLKMT